MLLATSRFTYVDIYMGLPRGTRSSIEISQFSAEGLLGTPRGVDINIPRALCYGQHHRGGYAWGEAVTASAIAKVLHESCHIVIARALKVLGPERCVELLAAALTIEHEGGMWLKDGSRKHSLGGVFLALCKEHSTPEEKRRIFR